MTTDDVDCTFNAPDRGGKMLLFSKKTYTNADGSRVTEILDNGHIYETSEKDGINLTSGWF